MRKAVRIGALTGLVAVLASTGANADDMTIAARADRMNQELTLQKAARDQFLHCVDTAATTLFDIRLRPGEIADAAVAQCEPAAESFRHHEESATMLGTSEPPSNLREDSYRDEDRLITEARRRAILVSVQRLRSTSN